MALSKAIKDLFAEFKTTDLTDEVLEEKLNKALGETHVPKAVFNEKLEAEKAAKAKVEEYETKVKELEKTGNLSEEQKKKIDELNAKLTEQEESYKTQLTTTKRNHALESAIAGAKARDVKSVLPHIDHAKLAWSEDNTLASGLKEQLEELQKSKAFLFEIEEEPKGAKPKFGGDKGGTGGADSLADAFAGALGLS